VYLYHGTRLLVGIWGSQPIFLGSQTLFLQAITWYIYNNK
jgi:hypothetical protein